MFDISEDVARRKGVAVIGSLAVGTAILFAVQSEHEVAVLRGELLRRGWQCPNPVQANIAPWVLGGALKRSLGRCASLGGRHGDLLVGAGIGAAMGVGAGKSLTPKRSFSVWDHCLKFADALFTDIFSDLQQQPLR